MIVEDHRIKEKNKKNETIGNHGTIYGIFLKKLGTYFRNKLIIADIMRMRSFQWL